MITDMAGLKTHTTREEAVCHLAREEVCRQDLEEVDHEEVHQQLDRLVEDFVRNTMHRNHPTVHRNHSNMTETTMVAIHKQWGETTMVVCLLRSTIERMDADTH